MTFVQKIMVACLVLIFAYILEPHCFKSKAALNREAILSSYKYIAEDDLASDEALKKNIDWDYMRYTDVAIGAVAEKIGVLSNFRFNNGFIENLIVSDNSRQFKLDSGPGSANVMSILYPSPSGILETGSKLNLTAKQIAQILGIVYISRKDNFILNGDFLKHINKLKEIAKSYNQSDETTQVESLKEAKEIFLKKKNECESQKESYDVIKKINEMLHEINLYIKLDDLFLQLKKNEKCVIKDLLINLSHMVNCQESFSLEPYADRPFPKYTAERMILGYFFSKFNTTEDVKNFYQTLKNEIRCEKSEKSKTEALSEIKKLHDMISKLTPNNKVPYYSTPVSNGDASLISYDENTNEFKIENSRFADCADTSIRHVVNFLMYDNKNKKLELPTETEQISNEEVLESVRNIQLKGTLTFRTLREKLCLYLAYQGTEKVNNGDNVTRDLWNYVVSNIDCSDKNIYDVIYMRYAQRNELSTGFLNAIKMYYNLAYALRDGQGCDKAKISIDNAIKELNNDIFISTDAQNRLREAFNDTFSLFNENYEFEINFGTINKKQKHTKSPHRKLFSDFFGDAYISVSLNGIEQFCFHICQSFTHAFTECNFENIIEFNEEDKILLENYNSAILYQYIKNQTDENFQMLYISSLELNDFDKLYSNIDRISITDVPINNDYLKKYVSLRLNDEIERLLQEDNTARGIYILKNYEGIMNAIEDITIRRNEKEERLLKFSLEKIYKNKYIVYDDRFFSWYVFFVCDKDYLRDLTFERNFEKNLEKFFVLKEILIKSEIKKSDLNFLDEICLQDFCVKYKNKNLLSVAIESCDDVFSEFLTKIYSKPTVPIDKKDHLLEILVNEIISAQRWDRLDEILNKYEIKNFDTVLFKLIQNEKFDLICKFRNRFDFNDVLYIDQYSTTHTVYSYIATFASEDTKEKLDSFSELKRKLLSSDERIKLSDIACLNFDDLMHDFNGESLFKKCAKELSDEDFILLMQRLLYKKTVCTSTFESLINSLMDFRMWNKLNGIVPYFPKDYITKMFSDLNIFRILMEGGNYSALKTIVEILYECNNTIEGMAVWNSGCHTVRVKKVNALTYATKVLKNSTMADILDPNRKIIESMLKFKLCSVIPKYEDVSVYFEPFNGRSIMSAAIKKFEISEFRKFIQEKVFVDNWSEKRLFSRKISFAWGYSQSMLSFAVSCQRWDIFLELLNYVSQDDFPLDDNQNENICVLKTLENECENAEVIVCAKRILVSKGITVKSLCENYSEIF